MLREVFGKCSGFVITRLTLRKLPYNEQVMDAMVQYLPFVTVLEAFFDIASGHDQVPRLLEVNTIMPELRDISFRNDPEHPNANAFLRACASRKIPAVTLNYAEDVTETEILDFLSSNNRSGISREFLIVNLHRSLSATFFAAVVEACRRIECKSLYFGLSPLLSDPTDAKYSRYVVGRDESAAMYKFDAVGQVDRPFTIVVGKWESDPDFPIFHYYLNVFLGDVLAGDPQAINFPFGIFFGFHSGNEQTVPRMGARTWYDGVTKDNVIISCKACGIGAIGGADDHLVHCLKEGNGIPNGMYGLNKARETAEADDTWRMSDLEVVKNETATTGEENSGPEDE
ncbi:hypothetical protein AAVH_19986 [Aphelenchoides avenae]|nr:hypothetical protein AAVH_19986 [Aphelenchus avenae]